MIVYVVNSHPSVSETFVSREAEEVAKEVPCLIYSIEKPQLAAPPSVPYICSPASRPTMIAWGLLSLAVMLARPSYRLRLRRETGLRGFLKHAYAVAHGLRLAAALRRRRHRPTAIHAHFLARPSEVARIAARGRHRLIVTVHAADAGVKATPENELFLSEFDGFRCASEYVRGVLTRPRPDLPTRVIPCVVALPPLREHTVHSTAPVVLSVGRLIETKGYREAAAVVSLAAASRPEWTWTWRIVGEGPMRAELAKLSNAAPGNLRITLLGSRDAESVRRELVAASAFLLLPRQPEVDMHQRPVGDGLPVAIVEAMAAGLPVVTTPVAGIPEVVVDGLTGVSVADPVDLSARLVELLSAPEQYRATAALASSKVRALFDAETSCSNLRGYLQGPGELRA